MKAYITILGFMFSLNSYSAFNYPLDCKVKNVPNSEMCVKPINRSEMAPCYPSYEIDVCYVMIGKDRDNCLVDFKKRDIADQLEEPSVEIDYDYANKVCLKASNIESQANCSIVLLKNSVCEMMGGKEIYDCHRQLTQEKRLECALKQLKLNQEDALNSY